MGKMKQVNTLEEAAYQYAESVQAVVQANACGLPYEFCDRLRFNAEAALEELKAEAMQHFNNVYDGATE